MTERKAPAADTLKGVAIPLMFRTSKLSRTKSRLDEGTGKRLVIQGPRELVGYMEIYFSWAAVKLEEKDLLEIGKDWRKEQTLYRTHNVHGDHRYLIPAATESIKRYEAREGIRFGFDIVRGDPTSASAVEELQFIPCSDQNIGLFLATIQSLPFYIEVSDKNFWLHIREAGGSYYKVPSHLYSPRCWPGFGHPRISLISKIGTHPILRLNEIDWPQIAEQLRISENNEN